MNQLNNQYCPHMNEELVRNISKISIYQDYCHNLHQQCDKENQALWYCLHCGYVGCSRYSVNRCFQKHIESNDHFVAYCFSQKILWCNACDKSASEILTEQQFNSESPEYRFFENIYLQIIQKISQKLPHQLQQQISLEQPHHHVQHQGSRNMKIYGLHNLGNTCFFNSTLQPMLASYEFLEYIKESTLNEVDTLGSRIVNLDEQVKQAGSINPKSVFQKLIQKNRMYGYYNQQDSNECFLFLLDILEEDIKKLKVNPNHPFLGFYVYKTQCMNCKLIEYFFEKNSLLLLDLERDQEYEKQKLELRNEMNIIKEKRGQYQMMDNGRISMHKNVEQCNYDVKNEKTYLNMNDEKTGLTQLEKLIEDYFEYTIYTRQKQGFRCEKCLDQSTWGFKKYYLYSPPPVLVLCLKRFKQSFSFFKKSSKKVSIDKTLDLTRFLLQNEKKNKKAVYEFYAATHHSGSLGGGHYTSYVFKNGKWYYISDSHFKEVQEKEVLSSEAYMLFYRLIE